MVFVSRICVTFANLICWIDWMKTKNKQQTNTVHTRHCIKSLALSHTNMRKAYDMRLHVSNIIEIVEIRNSILVIVLMRFMWLWTSNYEYDGPIHIQSYEWHWYDLNFLKTKLHSSNTFNNFMQVAVMFINMDEIKAINRHSHNIRQEKHCKHFYEQ